MKPIILCIVTALCSLCLIQEAGFAMQYTNDQGSVMSPQCPTGGKEAEELYQLGRQHRDGHGVPRDTKKAEKFFEQALARGNAKAAILIGQMYMWDFSSLYPEAERKKYMMAMYEKAAKMGCPEAYLALGQCYEMGWGVIADENKSIEMISKAAEMDSPKGLEFYGIHLVKTGLVAEGRKLLDQSMALGNGDAAVAIGTIYQYQKESAGLINALRAGAKLGSKACIEHLRLIYLEGRFGQTRDEVYSNRLDQLYDSIDDFYPPKPIQDFDKQFPPKRILPFK